MFALCTHNPQVLNLDFSRIVFFCLLAPLRIDAEAISKSNISLTKKSVWWIQTLFLLTLWRWEGSENLFEIYPLLTDFQDTFVYCKLEKVKRTGKYLSEALIFAEHGENMLYTDIVLNVKNNFCTQDVLPMFRAWNFHVLNL